MILWYSTAPGMRIPNLTAPIIGKHAVYFEFLSGETGAIAEFDRFSFQ